MAHDEYTKREVDLILKPMHEKLDLILKQTTKHNGRLTRIEKVMLVFGTALTVLLIVNGSSLVSFVSSIIK